MRWLLGVALLSACPSYSGRVIVIDMRDRSAEMRWVLRGEDASDLASIREDYIEGDALETTIPGWTVTAKRLEPAGTDLHGVIDLKWRSIGDVELSRSPYAKHQLRFCPPPEEVVVRSNAAARTASGCVLWRKGTEVLRVETATRARAEGKSMLTWFDGAESSPVEHPP
jgi:hypothetical protein